MTPSDLIFAIQKAGGRLIPEADGRLLCQRIPREFQAELKTYKSEIIDLLREQATPRAKTPSVNKSTRCGNCKHSYRDHCDGHTWHFPNSWNRTLSGLNNPGLTGQGSWLSDDGWFSCLTLHCACGTFENGRARWCPCRNFINPHTGKAVVWQPEILPDTLCTSCGHRREVHCHKSKTETGITLNGVPYGCRHFPNPCVSTSCAALNGQAFCSCPQFKSPYRKPSKRKSKKAVMQPISPVPAPADGSEWRPL
jgi:hypothetical protein